MSRIDKQGYIQTIPILAQAAAPVRPVSTTSMLWVRDTDMALRMEDVDGGDYRLALVRVKEATASGPFFYIYGLADGDTVGFNVKLTARQASGGGSAMYTFVGAVARDVGPGSLRWVGAVSKTIIGEDIASWDAYMSRELTAGVLILQMLSSGSSDIVTWSASYTLLITRRTS
ncbi:MAG: hypothetical protein OEX12_01225 [Gammaproteobacteria bacterium]|nr:hypothetical protein [Gammaproteobacteria bacterium]